MSSKRNNDLNDQQEKFCREYAKSLNVTKSEQAAGYAEGYGFQLLRKAHIVARIEDIAEAAGRTLDLEQRQVLQEATFLAFSDISELAEVETIDDLKRLPLHVRHAVKRIRRRLIYNTRYRAGEEKGERIVERDIVGEEVMIEMHGKDNALKLLAMAKKLIGAGSELEDEEEHLAFTGMDVYLLEDKT